MNYKLRINKSIFAIILSIIVISVPVLSFAQNPGLNPPSNSGAGLNPPSGVGVSGKIINPLGDKINTINGLIKTILEAVIKIGIPIVALAIIYCGFLFVKAIGKPEEIKKAKDALLYTVIGAAILLGAWTIAQLISDTVIELGK